MPMDPHRPRYHFLPPHHWMNDPNGLIQFDGLYHLFYQHNPLAAEWGRMVWGHAISRDLVHWEHLPIALAPDQLCDKDGVWSGCVVSDGATAAAFYTGVNPEVQCLATSQDLLAWEKYAGNPIIAAPPDGMAVTGFRDPYVWRAGGLWHMLVGSGIRDVGGAALLYQSPDLHTWTYRHPICVGDRARSGEMWECPNLFPLGDKWVLMVSPFGRTIYFTGTYADDRFTPDYQGEIDLGGCFYAPQVFRDDDGRRIMFGWLFEWRDKAAQLAAGWAGVQSLPRVLSLGAEGRLHFAPAPEVETLRRRHTHHPELRLLPGGDLVPGISGDQLELSLTLHLRQANRVGVRVAVSPDGAEETRIIYDRQAGVIGLDTTRASLDRASHGDLHAAPLTLRNDEPLRLRVFLDHSVLEVYANDITCLTGRLYPSRSDSRTVSLFTDRPATATLDAWELASMEEG